METPRPHSALVKAAAGDVITALHPAAHDDLQRTVVNEAQDPNGHDITDTVDQLGFASLTLSEFSGGDERHDDDGLTESQAEEALEEHRGLVLIGHPTRSLNMTDKVRGTAADGDEAASAVVEVEIVLDYDEDEASDEGFILEVRGSQQEIDRLVEDLEENNWVEVRPIVKPIWRTPDEVRAELPHRLPSPTDD